MLTTTNDRNRALARVPNIISVQSNYLKYLPAIYSEDEFVGRFLLIFESIMGPIESRIGDLHKLYDPAQTPADFLPWLAGWLGLVLDENWPLERRRALVQEATSLYRWRGTKRGLSRYLEIYTGYKPEITDTAEGFTLGGTTKLGENAILGQPAPAFTFVVTFNLSEEAKKEFDQNTVRQIIESEKPAHTAYILNIR
jgi:phage tail-like protein